MNKTHCCSTTMDTELVLFICDSRGRGLDKLLRNCLCSSFILTYGGAGLYEAVHNAVSIIKNDKWTQIYLLAGLCSVTYKDPKLKTVSVRATDSDVSTEHYRMEVFQSLEFISSVIGENKLKCVVAPITGMDLSIYNKGQVVGLYDVQQSILNNSIIEINKLIVQVNEGNNIMTPWLCHIIHKRKRDKICHLYHKLASDGCHLTDEIRMAWAECLSDAVLKNSGN